METIDYARSMNETNDFKRAQHSLNYVFFLKSLSFLLMPTSVLCVCFPFPFGLGKPNHFL